MVKAESQMKNAEQSVAKAEHKFQMQTPNAYKRTVYSTVSMHYENLVELKCYTEAVPSLT